MIERTLYPSCDLIIHRVHGELEEVEFRAAAAALYDMEPPPRLSMWDLSEASITSYTLNRMQKIQSDVIGMLRGRRRGKTALVAPAGVPFALGQQYAALATSLDQPVRHQVFRTKLEALAWLEVAESALDDSEASSEVLRS